MFRIITLPIRVTSDKFVQSSVDYTYFGLQHNLQTYLLFTEASFSRCNKGSIVTCKADTEIFYSQTNTCESSFFFKAEGTHQLCRRKLLVHHNTPSLRYGALWVYQFTTQHRVTLHCAEANAQFPRTPTLEGAGLLRNFTGCHITSPELQTFPEIHGTTDARIEPPIIYLPDISVLNNNELQQIRDMLLPNLQRLNDIYSSHVTTHVRSGRHYAYSSSFTSTNTTNKLGYNPSHLHCHYYITQYPYLFPLQLFPKHLLRNL